MSSKTDLVIGNVFDRMMDVLPDSLKSKTKVSFKLVSTDEGRISRPVLFTVSSESDDDRWISFEFLYGKTDVLSVDYNIGSIDGGSIHSNSMYVFDYNDIDSSIDNFIMNVFISKISAIFKLHNLKDSESMKKLLNDVSINFRQYLDDSTKGLDVTVNKIWYEKKSCFVMNSIGIYDSVTKTNKTINADICIFREHIFIQFGTETMNLDKVDETSMCNLKDLIRDVINDNFPEVIRNMSKDD